MDAGDWVRFWEDRGFSDASEPNDVWDKAFADCAARLFQKPKATVAANRFGGRKPRQIWGLCFHVSRPDRPWQDCDTPPKSFALSRLAMMPSPGPADVSSFPPFLNTTEVGMRR
jgi:hypothetical protein